ncbi:Aspartyl/glutamyl-tRNA amidotransferase subunit B [Chytriomyces sp. MP71]|nr:Aspartyl/glutamyl-tRNA amidotransferase subunit B [Chytriomyces sp. MP71]
MASRGWTPVIGLEVHAQLLTRSKLFSDAPAFANRLLDAPNANVAPFDAAFPGTLPRLNRDCVRLALRTALALNSTIHRRSTFDRKHYFYNDLPHGFQITQHFQPFATGGFLDLTKYDGLNDVHSKRYRIQQIQIEMDSGKLSTPYPGSPEVLVDLNRAGVGVLEIVTEPDFHCADDVLAFMKKMQKLLWHIGVSGSEIDEGAWRCDVNISVQKTGSCEKGVRTELKHVSKFSVVKTAIEYEVARQIALLESGQEVQQETMGLDELGHTKRLRGKEDAPDYRYMPEPDLPALCINEELIDYVRQSLPESIDTRRNRLANDYNLSAFHIGLLMDMPGAVEYFEELCQKRDRTKSLSWLTSNLFALLNKHNNMRLPECPIQPEELGVLIDLVEEGSISGIRGKDVLAIMFDNAIASLTTLRHSRPTAREIATQQDWILSKSSQIENAQELEGMIEDLIAKHPALVKEIQGGRFRKLKFFAGQVMGATKGKADPVLIDRILKEKIGLQ